MGTSLLVDGEAGSQLGLSWWALVLGGGTVDGQLLTIESMCGGHHLPQIQYKITFMSQSIA